MQKRDGNEIIIRPPPRLLCCRAPRPRHHYLPIHDYSVLRLRCRTQTHHHAIAPLCATVVVYPPLSWCSTLPPLSSSTPCCRMSLPSLVHTCFPAHAPVRSPHSSSSYLCSCSSMITRKLEGESTKNGQDMRHTPDPLPPAAAYHCGPSPFSF